MKRLFQIFELTRNEQRVVLIMMIILIAIAFLGYERRMHRPPARPVSATELKPSPTRAKNGEMNN
jgi:hypothetical protein